MKGHPKYKLGDAVTFQFGDKTLNGEVYIIDAYGTFFDDSDVSYDIMVAQPSPCLYKHINERRIL